MQYLHSSSDEQVLLLGILEHGRQIGHRQCGVACHRHHQHCWIGRAKQLAVLHDDSWTQLVGLRMLRIPPKVVGILAPINRDDLPGPQVDACLQ